MQKIRIFFRTFFLFSSLACANYGGAIGAEASRFILKNEFDPRCQEVNNSAQSEGMEDLVSRLPVKVLIITEKGGGGHQIPAEVLRKHLDSLTDAKGPGEPKKIFKILDVIDITENRIPMGLFNWFFGREEWTGLKMITGPRGQALGNKVLRTFYYNNIKDQILGNSLQRPGERPDIIISVMPTGNNIINEVCESNKIPQMIIATDTDARYFIRGIHNKHDSSKLRFYVPHIFDTVAPQEIQTIFDFIVKEHGISVLSDKGYLLDPSYPLLAGKLKQKDPETLAELEKIKKEKLGMGPDDKAVLISIGAMGFGESAIKQYVAILAKQKNQKRLGLSAQGKKLHVVVACGRNQNCYENLMQLKKEYEKTGLILHPQQWLSQMEMAKFMALCNFGVMKPGGNTINQAMVMGLPLLLKSDSEKALVWEKYGKDQIIVKGFGKALAHVRWNGYIERENFMKEVEAMMAKKATDRPQPVVNNFLNEIPGEILSMIRGERKSTYADFIKKQ